MTACIFKLDRIGDFTLAIGAIRYIIREYGADQCLLIVSPVVSELAQSEFPETPVISIPWFGGRAFLTAFRLWRHVRPLLAEYVFQQLICLRHQPDLHRDIILSWIRAEHSVGASEALESTWYDGTGCSAYQFMDPIEYPTHYTQDRCKELQAHTLVLQSVFTKAALHTERLLPDMQSVKGTPGNYLLVSPFTTQPIRDFLPIPLAKALLNWQQTTRLPIRLCGTPAELVRLRECRTIFSEHGLVNVEILATPSLALFLTAIAEAGAVLTMETGTAHIATALDKPTVVLIGGGNYGNVAPWSRSEKQHWVTHRMECFGCHFHCIYPEPYCLRKIPSKDIAEALLAVWNPRNGFI